MIRIDYISNGAMRTEIVADYDSARAFMREHSAVTSFTTREVDADWPKGTYRYGLGDIDRDGLD